MKRTIQRAPEPPINFSRYYLLETKIFRHSRQFAAAKKSFEQALAMAPTNMEILREGYLLALDSGAASEAREILKRSLIVEPHAIDIALALIELDITLGKLAEARDLVTALKTNRRYIEPETLKNISSRFSSPVTR